MSRSTDTEDRAGTFRDAEAFLAELGVERRPIVVRLPEPDDVAPQASPIGLDVLEDDEELVEGPHGTLDELGGDEPEALDEGPRSGAHGDDRAPVSATEAVRLATEVPLADAVAAAVATIRRSTGMAPASEGRIRRKLTDRGLPPVVVERALEAARAERLVDDVALAAALVAEWRAEGHGARRLRDALRKREFDQATIDLAVAEAEQDDPMALAFDLAVRRAELMRHVEAETAYRRIAAYLARRGHPEAIARKAARDAVYDDRERERVAGH